MDYLKLASYATDFEKKNEGGVNFIFKEKIQLGLEFGTGNIKPQNSLKNVDYTVEGTYYRFGVDYIKQINPDSRLGLGLRFGLSNFDDQGAIRLTSPSMLFDDFNDPFERMSLRADWLEVVLTTESRFIGNLYIGGTFRVRMMNSYDEQTPIDVYTIPGYGRTFDNSLPVINLFLKYFISL